MDINKISVFITTMRKEKGFTQKELADKLSVTDRAVSKWECGKGLPDVSIMPPLCELLGISINELLAGEKILQHEVAVKAERQILDLLREREANKKKLWMQITVGVMGVLVLLASILLGSYVLKDLPIIIATVAFGIVVFIVSIIVAIAIDIDTGYFECPICHNKFVPTAKEYVGSVHTFTKRRLKCPSCGEIGLCKKRLSK